jgi:hypothetical protein
MAKIQIANQVIILVPWDLWTDAEPEFAHWVDSHLPLEGLASYPQKAVVVVDTARKQHQTYREG